jgi:Cys-tRNA synthase (O-phospho-L-seryl-tRNA:Cys-tRNA synthase)
MIWIGIQSEKLVERVEVHSSHGPRVGGEEKNQSLNQCPSSTAPIIVEIHGVIVVEAAVQSWEDEVAKVQQYREHAERGNQAGFEQT